MSGAQAVVRSLEAEGVDTVFALPGVQIMPLFDALHASRQIRLITCRHEQTTTYAADGYARVTGKPGVALVVPGPGATNALAGVGDAYATSSPVLLISGQIPSDSLGKNQGQLHEIEDQLDVFRPLTKWVDRQTAPAGIPGSIHEAFRQMTTGRPRPVELEFTPDALRARAEIDILEPELYQPPQPPQRKISGAAELLSGARRPVIWAGGGTLRAKAGAELAAVAEHLQAPIVTTPQAKGVLPPRHPLYVGVTYSQVNLGTQVLKDADVILVVGSRFLEAGLEIGPGQKVIHIDADAAEIGRNQPTDIGIATDARAGLAALLSALEIAGSPRPPEDRAAAMRLESQKHLQQIAGPQLEWVMAVREALPEDAVLVAGATTIGYWSHVAYDSATSGDYITSGYWGTLGYGFPTAIGAKVGAKTSKNDRPVVALCGDGGFMYAAPELLTARQYGINVIAVVFDNGAYGASRWDQRYQFGDREIGTEIVNPDWPTLAQAFGVASLSADTPAGLRSALERAVGLDSPVLIDVDFPLLAPPFQLVTE
ncbi:MAG: thiamine pyrophosphate-binding protein [Chloroflexi bacterium]|nr:thiamine pyrophosphate-binding protein [Chloroflexota bacterium]